jgi:hypothetical protein
MDRSLYPDSSFFLRELLQNAIDACRRKEALAKEKGYTESYRPSIAIWDHSADADDPRLVFQDNGIGMSLRIVENYFMNVGKSYYRSMEFDAERRRLERIGIELDAVSQFGIGILSCFLVADRFEVETHQFGHEPLHIKIEGTGKYFLVQKLEKTDLGEFPQSPRSDAADGPPLRTGTRLTLHLRHCLAKDPYQVVNNFAANIDYPVRIYQGAQPEPRIIKERRWEESVRFADFKRFRNEPSVESEPFESILSPSLIPFPKWSFSAHIRGRAWLWLLRGEGGRPCPSRGYLKIHRWWKRLGFSGVAAVCEEIEEMIYYLRPMGAEFIPWFADAVPSFLRGESGTVEQVIGKVDCTRWTVDSTLTSKEIKEFTLPDIFNSVARLSARDVELLLQRIAEGNFGSGEIWYKVEGVPEQLLLGRNDWISRPLRFYSQYDMLTGPQEISVHSIRIPGGLVKWEQEKGEMKPVGVLCYPGGVQIDLRGRSAPVPSASRLFVPLSEAGKIVVPFSRAVLRHAADLLERDYQAEEWRSWLRGLMWSLRSVCREVDLSPRVLVTMEDFAYIAEKCRYKVKLEGAIEYLSGEELRRHFGKIAQVSEEDESPGLVNEDVMTSLMEEIANEQEGVDRPGSGKNKGPRFLPLSIFGEWL